MTEKLNQLIASKQKKLRESNQTTFRSRNKNLIIAIGSVLLILWIFSVTYVYYWLPKIYKKVSDFSKPSLVTSTHNEKQDPRTSSWKKFESDVIRFQYPSDWSIPESTPNHYVFFNDSRVMDVSWGSNVGKDGTVYKPSDFFGSGNARMPDIKRNENSVDGHEAIEFLTNSKGMQGWPTEKLVISVPEKSLIIQIEFSPAVEGKEMEKQVQNIFVPLISTIQIK